MSSKPNDLRKIMDVNMAMKRDDENRRTLNIVKMGMRELIDRIEESVEIEYTGSFVLLKRDGEGWAFVMIFDPQTFDDMTEPEWDLCLPIPKPETVSEFHGW